MFGFLELRQPHQWSSTDKDASFTISNNGLTISGGGGSDTVTYVSARCTQRLAPNQKFYFEFTLVADSTGWGIGMANGNAPLTTYLGGDTNGVTYAYSTFSYGGVQTGSVVGTTVGDVVGLAIDGINGKIWRRINAGSWNDDVLANQDPANNIGGISCSGVFGLPVMIGFVSNNVNESQTLNAGSTAFAHAPPVGFRSPNSAVNV